MISFEVSEHHMALYNWREFDFRDLVMPSMEPVYETYDRMVLVLPIVQKDKKVEVEPGETCRWRKTNPVEPVRARDKWFYKFVHWKTQDSVLVSPFRRSRSAGPGFLRAGLVRWLHNSKSFL